MSTISLLSLSSHRSNDMLLASNAKDISPFLSVMAGNEYTPRNSNGPASPSSTPNAGTSDRDASKNIQNQGSINALGAAVEPRHPTSSPVGPPNKKIKLEHTNETIRTSAIAKAGAAASDTAQAPSNTALSDKVALEDGMQIDSANDGARGSTVPQQLKQELATNGQSSSRNLDAHEGSTVVTTATDADTSHQTGQSSSANSSRDSLEPGSAAAADSPGGISSTAPIVLPPAAAIAGTATASASAASSTELPLKSLTFAHLNAKYLAELEYMLREFRKLERQLLGAKGAAQLEESAGSRERREKLHSFILHLEDTVRQIELGFKLESEGKSTIPCGGNGESASANEDGDASKKQMAEESALSNLTKEKEEEENVQKLEEHILANLLPVKVRLKKQLAAQQGATQNPAGMPSRRGSLQPPSAGLGKGTFAEAAEKKRKQAEEARLAAQEQHERTARRVSDPSQFGKPLGGGGSSLTRNLHGATLGSTQRTQGHGVGAAPQQDDAMEGSGNGERKILYAGMVPGSTQQESGLSAASGVHDMITTNKADPSQNAATRQQPAPTAPPTTTPSVSGTNQATVPVVPKPAPKAQAPLAPTVVAVPQQASAKPSGSPQKKANPYPNVSEEEQRKLRKKRRKRKLQRLARRQERERLKQQNPSQQQPSKAVASSVTAVRKKPAFAKGQKKKGPRSVEYICALCSEAYTSTCDYNPWWALAQHECPKCRKSQIPRIDITSSANAIEYHPALLAHIEDNSANNANSTPASPANGNQAIAPAPVAVASQNSSTDVALASLDSESDTDLSELSDDDVSLESLDSEGSESDFQSMSPAEQAEHETFGSEYKGPCLSTKDASRLLILMGHASTCPCQHRSPQHEEICTSTKYMMLHVRDCPGTTATLDVCPFPWCRKVKHLLYHLVSCQDPEVCSICNHEGVPKNMKELVGLTSYRMKSYREKMIAAVKAARAASRTKAASTSKHATNGATSSGSKSNGSRKLVPVAPVPLAPAPLAKGSQDSSTSNFSTTISKPIGTPRTSNTQKPSSQQISQQTQVKLEDPSYSTTSNMPSETSDFVSASVPDPTIAAEEDEGDFLPTPISAMKMEDDEEENVEVSELLAAETDDVHMETVESPSDLNTEFAVMVSEAGASNTSSSEASPGGRSSSDTPSPTSLAKSATNSATSATTVDAPSEPTAASSSTPATSDAEKPVVSVKVN